MKYLEDAESSFAGLSQSSANLLQKSQKGRFSGELSALSAYLEVPEDYEQAVASYLGERIHAVLVDPTSSLEDVLKFLSSESNGRTVLATARNVKPNHHRELGKQGVIGLMSELVRFPEKYGDTFKALMNHVVIVEDRKVAQALTKEDLDYVLVTMTGEIFYPDGIIIAGSDNNKTGIISRPREKRELNEKIKVLQSEEEALRTSISGLEHKQAAAQKILHDLEVDLDQRVSSLTVFDREIFQQNSGHRTYRKQSGSDAEAN